MQDKNDISQREDIIKVIDTFYSKAMKDKSIGLFFTEVIQLNLEKHMPVMYQFWDSVLLGGNEYRGNPMDKHLALNQKHEMTKEHFDRWLFLFNETIDSLYAGPIAEKAKVRAASIATMMQIKIHQSKKTE